MNTHDEEQLRTVLRGLPLETAPAGLWPKLAAQLDSATPAQTRVFPRRTLRSWAPWLALAAGMTALALSLNLGQVSISHPGPDPNATLAALQEQSRKLELRLASLRSKDARYSARAARLEQSLAEGLALTDLQLSVAQQPQVATELWQRRVALLSTWLDLNAIGPQLGDAETPTPSPNPDSIPNDQEAWL